MVTNPSKPVGAPIWIEIDSPDPEVSADFYSGLLDVRVSQANAEFGGLRNLQHRHGSIGAMMPSQSGDDAGWVVYLHAADLDATLRRVAHAGGEVTRAAGAVGAAGRLAMIRDPSGADVGLWQPGEQYGVQVEAEPGSPCWYELHARDRYDETVEFYRRVLGWTTESAAGDDDRHVTYTDGAGAHAGITDVGDSTLSHRSRWWISFAVPDVHEAAIFIGGHGGATLEPDPIDSRFGRLHHAADPFGARFCVLQPPS